MQFPIVDCKKGEQWLLLGQSGSGKTTLLHLLAGLRKPNSGKVLVNNTEIFALSRPELDKFRGKEMGMVFQQPHFVRALNVSENMRLAQKLAGMPIDNDRIHGILEQLNIAHKKSALPHQLSVGERQRASIARALVNKPAVIFADEPTSALDDTNTDSVLQLLRDQAAAAQSTLLIVTHDNRLKSAFQNQILL